MVLIVDDSESAREMYAEYLNYRGFWTITAPDGAASVPVAINVRPAVIVMDLAMPRLDGVGAIRQLKQHPRTRGIPVILLTGHAVQAIEQGALEAGAAAFLTKPCLPEDLEQHIQRLIARTGRGGDGATRRP
jgi:two-component system, cell cycle response regulator DivK